MTTVVEVTADQLSWPFESDPYLTVGDWRTRVDPFPCYAHDVAVIKRTLRHVEEQAGSVGLAPRAVYVLHHDTPARTNGWAQSATDYDDEQGKHVPARGWVVLPGKRIPIHPAMSRYVVAHEYGHHVEYDLIARRGEPDHSDTVKEEYAALRGLDGERCYGYGGGRWHSNVGELIANDFRILVCDVETEFWPHPGFKRPAQVKGLARWWREALA